ncbi:butyrophilin subfamily 2 member A2-like [Pelobates fuscus]|uniref:butyrophilin subfamily 2 member A2-like n=1 Tax=Pelobates fuscus TaxID=191477 RepID=UPI002FE4A86C
MGRTLGYGCVQLLSLTVAISAQFQVTSKSRLGVVVVGTDAVLPCTLSPPSSPLELEVRWFKNLYTSVVFMLKKGNEEKEQLMPDYRGRTSLQAGPQTGDLSLSMHNVQLSDAGIYHCFVENKTSSIYEEAITELSIVAVGSLPNLTLSLHDNSILISSSSSGWFPEPEIVWKEIDGTQITVYSNTTLKESNGLFNLENSILLKDASDGHFSYAIRHPVTGKDTGVHMSIHENMFPRISLWLYAFLFAVIVLSVVGIGAIFYVRKLQREKDCLTGRIADLSSELDWRKAVMNPECITFSPETCHPELSVSEDYLTLLNQPPAFIPVPNDLRFETERCCICLPDFSSGCHYWEVELGPGVEWAVGVASPEVRKKGAAYQFSPRENIWCIALFIDTIQALDNTEKIIQVEGGGILERVGVYLKLSVPRQVSFYDTRNWSLLYTFQMESRNRLKVQPFFWLGNKGGIIRLMRGRTEVTNEQEGLEDEHLL